MAYVTRAQVNGKIPAAVLNDALDDDGDGTEDAGAFDGIVATASLEVDGYLSGLFSVPFSNPPPKVQTAALIFVLEILYQRRQIETEKNPFTKPALWWREHLQKVGNRELPFDAATPKSFAPGIVTQECGAINGSSL